MTPSWTRVKFSEATTGRLAVSQLASQNGQFIVISHRISERDSRKRSIVAYSKLEFERWKLELTLPPTPQSIHYLRNQKKPLQFGSELCVSELWAKSKLAHSCYIFELATTCANIYRQEMLEYSFIFIFFPSFSRQPLIENLELRI